MRIFLTGATGYLGGAIAPALRARGHEVTALVRPDAEARALRDAGVVIVTGDLDSLPSQRETVAPHDVVINFAQPNTPDAAVVMQRSTDFFTSLPAHFISTSGVWVLGSGKSDESTPTTKPLALVAWRPALEQQVLATGRGAVLRPGCVYGGRQSLLAGWFAAAEKKQPIEIIGDGENRWSMVNLHDLADLYVRAVEQKATGILHGVDDTRATLNECARAIAPGGEIQHIPADAVRPKLGAFTDALILDQQVSSEATRKKTGWQPKRDFVSSVDEQWREWRELAG